MIGAGSQLSFTVRGRVDAGFKPIFPNTLREAVIARLRGSVDPVDVAVSATSNVMTGLIDWDYSATASVKTLSAHARQEDVGAIVANAFWTEAGSAPVVKLASGSVRGVGDVGGGATNPPSNFAFGFNLTMLALIVVGLIVVKKI